MGNSHYLHFILLLVARGTAFQPATVPSSNSIFRCNITPLLSFRSYKRNIITTMDSNLSRVTSSRMTSLFAGDTDQNESINFAEKNRTKELKRLSKMMEMEIPQLQELLKAQVKKMDPNSPKAMYAEWIIGEAPSEQSKNSVRSSQKIKRRKDSDADKRFDDKNNTDGAQNIRPHTKKSKVIRPPRKTSADNTDHELESDSIKTTSNLLTSTKFADLKCLHPASKRAIKEVLKLTSMTEIQSKTFDAASSGADVLGRARTGTGKTMAFLLPALESLIKSNDYAAGTDVGILVVSPTRELATQIGDQAEKLLKFHHGMNVQVVYGGTKIGRDVNFLNKKIPTILVATPGRLLDLMENVVIGGRKFGYDIMRKTPILVLDETDRLLDMGFRREIKKIMTFLPRIEHRQTLLFSATVPAELKEVMSENMKKNFVEVDCINDDAMSGEHTNVQVDQSHVILPHMDRYVVSVVEILKVIMNSTESPKIVVFFPTARLVGFFAEFFNVGLGIEVIELHSRKSQAYRNKASDKFRKAKSAVLFTSDVSARGVDYPDVTNVLQFGLPESREQYIHRLGRTGRAGKNGKGLLVLAPFESKFLSDLKALDVPLNKEMSDLLNNPTEVQTVDAVNAVVDRVKRGDETLTLSAKQAYQAFLGYYLGQIKRTHFKAKTDVVNTANFVSTKMGLDEIPALQARTVGKMGLKGVSGVVIEKAGTQRQGGPRHGERNNSRMRNSSRGRNNSRGRSNSRGGRQAN